MALRQHKPLRADPSKTRDWQDRSRRPLARKAFWQSKKGTLIRRTAIAKVNAERVARKRKTYTAHLRSKGWKELRYAAFLRSGGLCECDRCATARKGFVVLQYGESEVPVLREAHTPVEVWFVKSGKTPADRFRGGSVHHVTYRRFGEERLSDIQFMHPTHHAAVEAEHGTRRRFLGASK